MNTNIKDEKLDKILKKINLSKKYVYINNQGIIRIKLENTNIKYLFLSEINNLKKPQRFLKKYSNNHIDINDIYIDGNYHYWVNVYNPISLVELLEEDSKFMPDIVTTTILFNIEKFR